MYNKSTKFDEIRCSHFWENRNLIFFEWTTFNFKSRLKTEIRARDICKTILHIEFEWEWSVGSGPALGRLKKLKHIFQVSGIFSAKADSIIFLGFVGILNPQNLMKFVGAIFEKIEIIFFQWTALNFKGRSGTKIRARDICKTRLLSRFSTRLVCWFRACFTRRKKN